MSFRQESRYVTVNSIKVHYVVSGCGPPLLLLHGLGASAVTWRDNVDPLSHAFRVYALDLPGHGESDKPVIDYDSNSILQFLVLIIDKLGMDKPSIIGNSVGGALALMIALRHPDKVSKLVLVNSASLGRDLNFFLRLVSIPLLGKFLDRPNMNGTEIMLNKIFHDRSFVTHDLVTEISRSRSLPGAKEAVLKVIRNSVNLMGVRKEYILLDQLKSLETPLMVVWGTQDKILPVSHAHHALKKAPNAKHSTTTHHSRNLSCSLARNLPCKEM